MNLQELLEARGLTKALIVDDGYDAVPRAQDMVLDSEAWSIFFADLGEDRKHLAEVFPAFSAMTATDLQQSDAFVSVVWNARGKLRPELWDQLFESYEQATGSDRKFLDRLEEALRSVGVTPIQSGRSIPAEGHEADIIFADLFLGTAQGPADIELSVARLKELLKGREDNPAPVILMSRSELLDDNKARFRDGAKLLGAMFRVYRKKDLLEGGNLVRVLERLALHYPDAVRVARFTNSWEKGLLDASERFLSGIRRLDLADYAQIREVLLNFEGQPLGSYLLDIFDRVLQHEIEGDNATIDAAEALNEIDPKLYPAPHISGTADLQELVYRTIWQNPRRLRVKSTVAAIPLGFGDVLIRQSHAQQGGDEKEANDSPDAFIVLTPACDLTRDGEVKRVLLVGGTLSLVTSKEWSYSGNVIKTPIIVLPGPAGERRMWVRWNAKDIRTLLPGEVATMLAEGGEYRLTLRLRESHALEIQQKVLSLMGRVGLITPMPATFRMEIAANSCDTTGAPRRLALPTVEREGGVCYTGRDAKGKENSRLVLTEPAIDELLEAISKLSEDDVIPQARETLKRLKASTSLAIDLQRGLEVPPSDKSGFGPLKASAFGAGGETVKETVGLIARNPAPANKPELRHSGFVLILTDPQPERPIPQAVTGTNDAGQQRIDLEGAG